MAGASTVSCTFSLSLSGTIQKGHQSELLTSPCLGVRAEKRFSRVLLPSDQSPQCISSQKRSFMVRGNCGEACEGVSEGGVRMGCVANGTVAVLLSWGLLCSSLGMAVEEKQPKEFDYYQIWVSRDGETHIAECKMTGFNLTAYSSLPQYVRTDFGGMPIATVLTELPVGLEQPLHSTPQVQFVTTLSGSWYIETTDGSRHNFKKGELLFQDNTRNSPAAKQPMHYSGTHGDKPCHQLIVQLSRPPQLDNPCPF